MIRKVLAIVFIVLFVRSGWTQVPHSPSESLTPNAKSYERYGDIPVSLYTGTPNITIPLDTIASGKLSLPISLSYHSGGIRAEEHPGWVGLGWTLYVGGVITREVRDSPDEYVEDCGLKNQETGRKIRKGFMYHSDWLRDSTLFSDPIKYINFIKSLGEGRLDYSSTGIPFMIYDTEPDIFRFNFCGYSGFFIIGSDGKWKVSCNSPMDVQVGSSSYIGKLNGVTPIVNYKCIDEIRIIDPDGIKYIFGKEGREFSIDITRQEIDFPSCNTWKLTGIIHPNGDFLKFEYEQGEPIASLSFSEQVEFFSDPAFDSTSSPSPFGGQLIFPTYMKTIRGNDLRIDFDTGQTREITYSDDDYLDRTWVPDKFVYTGDPLNGDGQYVFDSNVFCYLKKVGQTETNSDEFARIKWRKLTNIYIKNAAGKSLKTIQFNYNDNPRERLALKNVRIYGLLDFADDIYQFRYKDLDKLPKYLSNQTDHWGFYNEKPRSLWETGICQETNPQTASYGLLNEIIYPTGGRTVLEFEPNSYTSHLDVSGCNLVTTQETYAGGARIKRVTDYDIDGIPSNSREYLYVKNYDKNGSDFAGSGILEGCPVYSLHREFGTLTYDIYSTASLVPIFNPMGDIVTYPEVAEIFSNGSYIIHKFTGLNQEEYKNEPLEFALEGMAFDPYVDNASYRGRPIETKYFDSMGILRKKTVTTYEPLNGNKSFVRGIGFAYRQVGDLKVALYTILHTYLYKIYNYNLVVKETRNEIYEDEISKPQVEIWRYSYNSKGQMDHKTFEFLEGKERRVTSVQYHYMWEKDVRYLEKMQLAALGTEEKSVNGNITMKIQNTYNFLGDFPVLTKVSQSYGKGDSATRYQCIVWDKKGNPVFVIWNNRKIVCYLWGFDYTFPVAEFENINPIELMTALGFPPEEAPYHYSDIYDIIGRVKALLPHAFVTTYTYTPHIGITSITDPSGKKLSYSYDSFGRLLAIRNLKSQLVCSFETSKTVPSDPDQNYQDWNYYYHDYFSYSVSIEGANVLLNDSTLHYRAETGFIPGECRWSIEGDSSLVDFIPRGDEVTLHSKHRGNNIGMVILKLSTYDGSGKLMANKSHVVQLRPKELDVDLVPYIFSKDSVAITVFVRDNSGHLCNEYDLYVNGMFYKRSSDWNNLDFRRISILRDLQRKYYLFTIRSGDKIFTREILDANLFN